MTQQPSCLYVEGRTAEELAELRLKTMESTEHSLLRALKAGGVGTTNQGGHFLAAVDKNFCSTHCPIDPERPLLTQPRIQKFGALCPVCGQKSSFRKVTDRWMKTPKKRQAFLAKAQPKVKEDPDFVVAETAHNYERRGLGTSAQEALANADVNPSEPFRICRIRCRDMARAVELAEAKRDELPWITGLRLRPDGSLAADWHGGTLSVVEQRLLKAQQDEDRAAKRSQRDRAIRDLRREVI
jgi:hypothetical protein